MSDNLRDRIIQALVSRRCDLEEFCEDCLISAAQDADAVIRELSLQPQRETGEIVNLSGGEPIKWGRSRYVTDWVADE